jgi:hypothetical protein
VADEPQKTADACLRCGEPLYALGPVDFRIGGRHGGWSLLLGNWADWDEDVVKLEVLACKHCRRLELKLPDET